MKRWIALFLSLVLLLAVCSCGEQAKKKKIKKVIIIDDPVSSSDTTGSDEDEDVEDDSEDFDSEETDEEVYVDTSTDEDNGFADNTINVEDQHEEVIEHYVRESTYLEKVTAPDIGKDYYRFAPEQMHPGVVGLDAHYTMIARNKTGARLEDKNIVMKCDKKGVKISGNILTIPYALRDADHPLTVTMYDKRYPNRTGSYVFNFRKFSSDMSFDDEFDFLDKTKWVNNWYGDLPYGNIEDGKLVYRVTDRETPMMEMSTSGLFKQAYGCFSCRLKTAERGVNNVAFWMASDYNDVNNHDGGHERYIKNIQRPSQSSGEVDVIEQSAKWGDFYASTVHWNGWSSYHQSALGNKVPVDNPSGKFHIYSVVWTDEAFYFYCDENLTNYYTGDGVGPDSGPLVMLVQCGNHPDGSDFLGYPDQNEQEFPFSAEFDWVRVWTLDDLKK